MSSSYPLNGEVVSMEHAAHWQPLMRRTFRVNGYSSLIIDDYPPFGFQA